MNTFLKETGEFAAARCRELSFSFFWEVAPVFGELTVATFEIWCAFVLTLDPHYMETSSRLSCLLPYAPQAFWQITFYIVGFAKMFLAIFGSAPFATIKDRTYFNPFMRTHAAIRDWSIIRALVLFLFGGALNMFISYLFSKGGPSIPTGIFAGMWFVSMIALGNVLYRLVYDWLAKESVNGFIHTPRLVREHLLARMGGS